MYNYNLSIYSQDIIEDRVLNTKNKYIKILRA